eukprot:3998725-Amphidinium_carterae.1
MLPSSRQAALCVKHNFTWGSSGTVRTSYDMGKSGTTNMLQLCSLLFLTEERGSKLAPAAFAASANAGCMSAWVSDWRLPSRTECSDGRTTDRHPCEGARSRCKMQYAMINAVRASKYVWTLQMYDSTEVHSGQPYSRNLHADASLDQLVGSPLKTFQAVCNQVWVTLSGSFTTKQIFPCGTRATYSWLLTLPLAWIWCHIVT